MVRPEDVASRLPAGESGGPAPEFHIRAEDAAPLAPPWSFTALIHPIEPAAFCSDYWGEWPLHIARGRADFFAGLISLAEIERYLSLDEIFSRHSVTLPRQGYGAPDPPPASISELYQRLLDGGSLRLRRLECLMDPAAPVLSLLREIVLALQHPTDSLSCYIAPPNSAGLGPHHDETEIFTLQISGMKRWRIYHRVDTDRPGIYDQEQLGPPSQDFVLRAGDLLYLPRGWVHEVTSEAPAFSLTIVFDPVRWSAMLDLLRTKLTALSPFLAPLPAGVLLGGGAPDSLREEFNARVALIREALSELSADALADGAARHLVGRMTLPPDSQLGAIFNLDRLTLDTVVEKRPGIACHLTRSGDRIVLILPGGYTIEASERAEPALRSALAADRAFRVAEMHDSLGTLAKLALAKKLVSCGLLRIV